MKLWIWLLLSMLMLSFAGCQPTPAKPAVVKKAAGVAESQDNEGAAYAFPATWSETIQYANFEVDIDAAIRADGNAPYSIWEAEARDFTEKDVYDLVERVLPGKQLYEYSNEPTKEEYERTIQEIGRMLTETKARSPETYNDIAGEWLDYAGQLAVEMENAGPDRETAMESCRFRQDDGMQGSCLKIKADNGKNMLSSIVVRNSEYETSFTFNNYDYAQEPFQYAIPCPDEAKGAAYDTAVAAGDSFLHSLGLTEYGLFDVALTPHGTKSWVFATQESPSGEMGYYYTLYYTRTIDGVPVTYVDDESIMGDKPLKEVYAAPISNESILLQIDDTGVVQFIWEHPITIGAQETRAALLPWEAIQETMQKQMRYEKEADPRFGILTRRYYIDRITLGYALTRNPKGGYWLLPVWDFFGTLQQQFEKGAGDPANMDPNNVATVDTYDIQVHKYATGDDTGYLAGATFILSASETLAGTPTAPDYEDANAIKLVGSDGTYRVAKADDPVIQTYFTTNDTGNITINGLKAGTYYLHEVDAPDGYNKLTEPVKVEIKVTGEEGDNPAPSYDTPVYVISIDNVAQPGSTNNVVGIENKSGAMLPETGGIGTIGLTVAGVAVVLLGIFLPRRKKKNGKSNGSKA